MMLQNLSAKSLFSGAITQSNAILRNSFITDLTNSIDHAINDLCYEYSKDGVRLNSLDCVFVHKEVRCTNKAEIKDGLQYTNKKLSLPRDIIFTSEDIVMN